jgi:hypothetical protein
MIKKRPSPATYVSFVLVLGVFSSVSSFPQGLVTALPVEPPSSLFSTRLGDSDVEAFAQGFWEASVLSTGSFSAGSSDSGFNAVPFLFTQTPDLYVFLRFRQQWLFEAYITQNMAESMFSLAFEGDGTSFVRAARLGNAGITMPEYPYMAFGTVPGSFGATINAYDEDRDIAIDAMLRWDGLQWKTRTFFGSAEAREESLVPGDNLRGRRFVLPGAPVLYLGLYDTTLDGVRPLRSDEYSVSLATGVVLLMAEPLGTLTAAYRTSAGVDRTETLYAYTIDAGVPVRQDNPLEARNLYALSDTAEARQLFVRSLATGTTDTRFTVSRVAPGLIQVVLDDAEPDPASDAYMKPFCEFTPWSYDVSNGIAPEYASGEGFAIIARVVESMDTIVLDQETVAGTVSVYRDGVESASFSYEEQAHTLMLTPPARSGEQVQIRYAVESANRSDGALAFGLGTRFPWLGLGWATAIGGRWPLFGQGWDEGGELKSAWTGVSVGVAKETESLSFNLEAMARYLRAGSSGLYRIAGMEDGSLADTRIPFRAVAGDIDGLVPSVSVEDGPGAESAFSALLTTLHPAPAVNRVLILSVDGLAAGERGDETTFVRYVDPVPLSSYQRLSFFIKAEGAASASVLELRVGDGEGNGAQVSVPLDGLGTGWRKVVLDLRPAGAVSVCTGDGSTLPVVGATGSYAAPGSAGLVELVVTGLTAGSVSMDELLLEEAYDGFSGLAQASFSAGDKAKKSGPYLLGTGSGVIDAAPTVAANLEAGWVARAADLSGNWTPAFTSGTASYGLGYVVALPGRAAPTRMVDQFSRDPGRGLYARSLEAALAAGGFQALVSAGSTEESASFRQSWSAATGWRSLVSLSAVASLDVPEAVVSDLDFIDSWTESWRLMLPESEESATSRRMELSVSALGSMLTATANRSLDQSSGALNSAEARASVPLKFGQLSVEPYYSRSSSLESASPASSFEADLAEFCSVSAGAASLWSAMPVAELWTPGAFETFNEFAAGGAAADHRAELGLGLRRPIGYGVLDLFVPSAATAGFARSVAMSDDTVVESGVLSVSLTGGAANVFAANGAKPLLPSITFDEYSHTTSLSFSYFPSDGEILPSLTSNLTVSMEGLSGSVFALTSNLAYARTRNAEPWSEALGVALSTRPRRTWLGDLAGLALQARNGAKADTLADDKAEPGITAEKTWVSAWFDAVLSDPFVLRDSFGLEGSVGRSSTIAAPLVARTEFDYTTRIVAGSTLTLGAGAGLWQSLSITEDSTVWGFGYTFSIEAKVVF